MSYRGFTLSAGNEGTAPIRGYIPGTPCLVIACHITRDVKVSYCDNIVITTLCIHTPETNPGMSESKSHASASSDEEESYFNLQQSAVLSRTSRKTVPAKGGDDNTVEYKQATKERMLAWSCARQM